MTKASRRIDKEVQDLIEENKYPGWKFLIGGLHYQRKLKKRIGDMWTRKQEKYLADLERIAEANEIVVPRE